MRFRVTGRNKQTGREVSYVVEAADNQGARYEAEATGLDVDRVQLLEEPDFDAVLGPGEAWAYLCRFGRVAVIILSLIAILCGFLLGVADPTLSAGPLWCIAGILLLMLVKK